jgi:hypothetical protein
MDERWSWLWISCKQNEFGWVTNYLRLDWLFQTHSILKDVAEPQAGFDVIMPV